MSTVAALALTLTSASPAAEFLYNDRHWLVTESDKSCTLIGIFSDKKIWFRYDYGLDRVTTTLTNTAFKSAEAGKSYRVKVAFVDHSGLNDRWGTVAAAATSRGDEPGFEFALPAFGYLRDLSNSKIIGLYVNDVIVASLGLDGSASAVKALTGCARQINKTNPSDPLDGAEID